MPASSRQRWFIIGGLALLVAGVFCLTWLMTAGHAPAVKELVIPTPAKPAPKIAAPTAPAPAPPPVQKADPRAIDPEIQKMADSLTDRTHPPSHDLEIVNEFIGLYQKVFQQGNPIGLNEDITAVLTGQNAKKGILFPPNSPIIVKGQMVDRWGTPYWFHPSSSSQMEIRSAGPDKDLFTADDVVINPSPGGLGFNQQASTQ